MMGIQEKATLYAKKLGYKYAERDGQYEGKDVYRLIGENKNAFVGQPQYIIEKEGNFRVLKPKEYDQYFWGLTKVN